MLRDGSVTSPALSGGLVLSPSSLIKFVKWKFASSYQEVIHNVVACCFLSRLTSLTGVLIRTMTLKGSIKMGGNFGNRHPLEAKYNTPVLRSSRLGHQTKRLR